MSVQRLFLVDPYNDNHISMIHQFETENNIIEKISASLGVLRASMKQETYQERKKDNNEIDEDLFIEKNYKIEDMCHIHGEKDRKIAKITMAPLEDKKKNRKLLSLATNYVFSSLDFEEVFVELKSSDKKLLSTLKSNGYENLGEEDGKVIFLKDREEEKNMQRMIA